MFDYCLAVVLFFLLICGCFVKVCGGALGRGGQRLAVAGQAYQERGGGVRRSEHNGGVLREVRAPQRAEGCVPGGLQVYQRPLQGALISFSFCFSPFLVFSFSFSFSLFCFLGFRLFFCTFVRCIECVLCAFSYPFFRVRTYFFARLPRQELSLIHI